MRLLRALWTRRPPTRVVSWDQLTSEEIEAWHTIRAKNPALDSPYFHPGYAEAVHASGRPVEVVVKRGPDGDVTALLPGHRDGSQFVPVGMPGTDFQGPIATADRPPLPEDLLIDGLEGMHFDDLVDGYGDQFDPWISRRRTSPVIDTTGGLEGYLSRASKSGRENIAQARRRAAKAARTIGELRFAAHVSDETTLSQLIALKQEQYRRTGSRNPGFTPFRTTLVTRLLHTQEPGFAGMLSTLHAGDRLVAAHFGIRSEHVLHWWFPVYDTEFSDLSPGWIMLRELIQAAAELGIHRIDLGRGDEEYKRRIKTGESIVYRATLTPTPPTAP